MTCDKVPVVVCCVGRHTHRLGLRADFQRGIHDERLVGLEYDSNLLVHLKASGCNRNRIRCGQQRRENVTAVLVRYRGHDVAAQGLGRSHGSRGYNGAGRIAYRAADGSVALRVQTDRGKAEAKANDRNDARQSPQRTAPGAWGLIRRTVRQQSPQQIWSPVYTCDFFHRSLLKASRCRCYPTMFAFKAFCPCFMKAALIAEKVQDCKPNRTSSNLPGRQQKHDISRCIPWFCFVAFAVVHALPSMVLNRPFEGGQQPIKPLVRPEGTYGKRI